MATLPESVDYTDKDFDALRARLIALIKSVFPDWTDFDVASFGNLLVELYAYVGDVLTFYQDNLARESRLVTATQRKSVMALAKMLSYRLHGAQAATAEVWLQLARVPVASVTFPAGTVLRTQEVTEPVRFQLLAPAVVGEEVVHPVVLHEPGDEREVALLVLDDELQRRILLHEPELHVLARDLDGLELLLDDVGDREPHFRGSAQLQELVVRLRVCGWVVHPSVEWDVG